MAKRDYYEVLGVGKSADPATIKSAYRKMAMKYHPDRNGGDSKAEARFREATEAYDVLRDQQKRAAYDQFGHSAFDGYGNGGAGGGFSGFHQGAGGFDSAGFAAFDEIFSTFFGGGHRGQARGRHEAASGENLRYDIEVTLEEAFHGSTRQIKVPIYQPCQKCNNTGVAGGGEAVTCDTCQGVGQVRRQQGFFSILRTCPKCHGAGEIISNPCRSCGGDGRVQKDKTIQIKIPKGVDSDTRMTIRGEGHAGLRGGEAGNLYVMIHLTPHELFIRKSNTLTLKVPIPMTTASLGGDVDIPTLDGKLARVTIAAATQSGDILRLRGKGMPNLQGRGSGDMLVEIEVETPSRLTSQQKQWLTSFAENEKQQNPRVLDFANRTKQFLQKK